MRVDGGAAPAGGRWESWAERELQGTREFWKQAKRRRDDRGSRPTRAAVPQLWPGGVGNSEVFSFVFFCSPTDTLLVKLCS